MAQQFLPNAPFVNYFFKLAPDPLSGANVPNASGTLTFYKDEDHTALLNTYSDVLDPDNPVVNPNPIILGADGAAPLIYLQDALYYIVEHDVNGALVRTYSHYYAPFNGGGGTAVNAIENFVSNGQFYYPIDFSKASDPAGTIPNDEAATSVAWGWQFVQDANTTTSNIITFSEVYNDNLESNPTFAVNLLSGSIMSGEATKDFTNTVGKVNFREGEVVTFSAQIMNQSGNCPVSLLIEKNYGTGGSLPQFLSIASTTAPTVFTKWTTSFTLPTNAGKTISSDGDSFMKIVVRVSLGQICDFTMTNVQMVAGDQADPIFPEEDFSTMRARIVGKAININTSGNSYNYSKLMYTERGNFQIASSTGATDTGKMFIAPAAQNYPDAVLCDAASYNVANYSTALIPYSRLYGVIGQAYGGAGSLIVTSSANVVTFTLGSGGREHSAYSAGTAPCTVSQTTKGYQLGISAALTSGQTTSIDFTFLDNFAPRQICQNGNTYSDNQQPNLMTFWLGLDNATSILDSTTLNPGSSSTQAVGRLAFNSNAMSDYRSGQLGVKIGGTPYPTIGGRFLEFASVDNNARVGFLPQGGFPQPPYAIFISVDGGYTNPLPITPTELPPVVVPFLSTRSLAQNVQTFLNSVNNPFVDTVTFTGIPTAAEYFLFSSATVDYCAWFKVDGTGAQPTPPGFTGTYIEVITSAAFTTTQVAAAVATATNSLTFAVPAASNLPTIPDALSNWYIYL